MKKLLPIFITALLLVGCAAHTEREVSYRQITMDEAVAVMEEEEGYTNVVEFGGIIDWPGETETNEGGPL